MTFGVCFGLLNEKAQSPALRQILGGLMYFQYLGYPLMIGSPMLSDLIPGQPLCF